MLQGNHKRSGNCVGQAMEERQYFRGLVSEKSTTIPSPLPASSCIEEPPPPKKSKPAWVDTVTVEQKKCYDKTCANMFYDNAIPFVFAESESFKQFCKSLRPAYQPPSRKQIAGPLLDQDFAQIQSEIMQKIQKSKCVNLVSDGWSNIRNEHVVNFLVL